MRGVPSCSARRSSGSSPRSVPPLSSRLSRRYPSATNCRVSVLLPAAGMPITITISASGRIAGVARGRDRSRRETTVREPRLEDLAIGIGQPDLLRAGGGLRGADLRHPRQRDHQGIEVRHPRQRHLERRRAVPGGHLAERGIGGRPWRRFAPAERAVRQEPDLVADAVLHHAAQDGAVVPHAQLVLHGVDVGDAPRLVDLADGDVAQPDRLDQPRALQRRQRAHARRQRHARIDDVELVEIDRVDAEGAATALARRGRGVWPGHRAPIGLPAA